MGEDECGADDAADLARAGGDLALGAPVAGEQSEPAFSQAAQRALDGVAGSGIDIEVLPDRGTYSPSVSGVMPHLAAVDR
jgi:hypothetical protein